MSAKAVSGVARCGLHTYAVAAGKAMSKSAESKATSVFLLVQLYRLHFGYVKSALQGHFTAP